MVINCWLRIPLLTALGALLLTTSTPGAVFIVTKTTDDNGACDLVDCALREAVLAANALPGMDTVQVPPGLYQLSIPENLDLGGDIDITDNLEIFGVPGATTVAGTGNGGFQDRVFDITQNTVEVAFIGLGITGGHADLGGGVRLSNNSVGELIDCHIYNNEATQSGGGINFSVSHLTLIRTTIAGNTSQRSGGGIRRGGITGSTFLTSLVIQNSTISNNTAAFDGGAIQTSGGSGEIRIENSTIVGNQADFGSLIFQDFSIGPQFLNSILDGDCFFVASQFPMSLGGNVGGPNNPFCFLDQPSDQPDVPDLGLLPLGDYGGPTPTHALTQASPAVDSALLSDCPVQDQRGRPRPIDGDLDGMADCDAGAVELQVETTPVAVPGLGQRGLIMMALLIALAATHRMLLLK